MNRSTIAWSCAATTLIAAAHASAALVNLTPGTGSAVGGTTAAADPEIGGTVPSMADTLIPFQIFADADAESGAALLFEGFLQSRVIISDVTGNAQFAYRVRDVNGSLNGIIASITNSDFSGMQTLVEWKADGQGDTAPSRAERSASGADVRWLYGNGFPAGDESYFNMILTDQPDYSFTGSTTIMLTTGESVTLTTWIPAPGTLAMLPLAGAAALRRRRSN